MQKRYGVKILVTNALHIAARNAIYLNAFTLLEKKMVILLFHSLYYRYYLLSSACVRQKLARANDVLLEFCGADELTFQLF